jgi:hypothetical protein
VTATARLIMNAALRLMLLGFAMWIAFGGEDALKAPIATRIGIVLLFAALSIVLGEIAQQREHISLVMKMLRAGVANRRDDKEAIDILIQGLSAREAATREKAHHHLKRLTGQDMPAEAALWQAWWAANRDAFQAPAAP